MPTRPGSHIYTYINDSGPQGHSDGSDDAVVAATDKTEEVGHAVRIGSLDSGFFASAVQTGPTDEPAVRSGAEDATATSVGLSLRKAEKVAEAAEHARDAGQELWTLGRFKSSAKWEQQLSKRGWSTQQISEAVAHGEHFPAENLVNKGHPARRYIHPETGRSVVVDDVTKEVLHVGGDNFKY